MLFSLKKEWNSDTRSNSEDTVLNKVVKVAQLFLTLCNPMDCIVPGILQARILEWVAIPISKGSSQPGFFTS